MEDKVIVIVALRGGTENAEFFLVGRGPGTLTTRTEYDWPKLAFDIEGILAAKLRLGTMAKFHPIIAALKQDLQVTRDHIDETPRGGGGWLSSRCPFQSQKAAKSYSHSGKKKQRGRK